ncbi:hypothetical protein TWF696_009105 [Orbilia brochopaga]|uniref:Uncharacterized protein n=1 Tax=Orbilia brochopaga TaxID=3140254 RepID=A0AAV9UIQ4_9PEZI
MLGLVQYDSDEEEEEQQVEQQPAPPSALKDKVQSPAVAAKTPTIQVTQDTPSDATAPGTEPTPTTVLTVPSPPPLQGPSSGPQDELPGAFGPVGPPSAGASYPPSDDGPASEAAAEPPLSPYSRTRSLLRSYTMPTLAPDFAIPESPPGSPPPGTAKQFASFLKLKKKGVHFNQKLAQTTALRNPNLLENLMKHVGMDTTGQYASNWSKRVWNPDPEVLATGIEKRRGETAVQALARLQKEGFERRQAERTTVDFVVGTPSGGGQTEGRRDGGKAQVVPMSAAERVMSGLDRERKSSPAVSKRERERDRDRDGQGRRDDDRDRERDRERDRDRNRNRHRDDGRRDRYRDEHESDRHKRQRSRSRDRSRDRQRYRERDYGRR